MKRKIKGRHAALVIAALSVTAIAGAGMFEAWLDPLGRKIALAERNGEIPRLDRSKTLMGIDANRNGVRDDIEAIIAAKPFDAPQKAALTALASSIQKIFSVDVANMDAVQAIHDVQARAVACVFVRFPKGDDPVKDALAVEMTSEMEAITMNTRARSKRYMAYADALSGSVFDAPEGDVCA